MAHISSYRSIWLSDVHLGTRACRADFLLDFLNRTRCDVLYLLGDIIDLQRLRRSFYWPASHTQVLRLVLAKQQQGTQVIYIPGNHDHELRAFAGHTLAGVEIQRQAVHTTRSGKRLLMLHGDEFDQVIKYNALECLFGAFAYGSLLSANQIVHRINALLGRPYWSLAQHVKTRLGKAVRYVENFRDACLNAARESGLDGVVCGHIHKAHLAEHDGLLYCNDGDWVESCTALVEDRLGRLSLLNWPDSATCRENVLSVKNAA